MQLKGLFVAALVATLGAGAAHAAGDDGETQLSIWAGEQYLRVNHDVHFRDETHKHDQLMTGVSLAHRWPAGFYLEGGFETATHETDNGKDNDFTVDHYSAAIGWQFDSNRWSFTPKIGVTQSQLGNDARLLIDENGDRVFHLSNTVGYVGLDAQVRVGRRMMLGATLRDTDEDWGHTRSAAFRMSFLW
jgi:hypothetical protein